MLVLVAHWYENRENSQMDRLENIPFGYEAMLNLERSCWYG